MAQFGSPRLWGGTHQTWFSPASDGRRAAQLQIRQLHVHGAAIVALSHGRDFRRVFETGLVPHDGGKGLILIERARAREKLDHLTANDDIELAALEMRRHVDAVRRAIETNACG